MSVYEQVVYAVKKAVVSGQLQPGDSFPSVRTLSQELQINPNTAHKAIATLIHEGMLEVKPGVGTLVARVLPGTGRQRSLLLKDEVERLVVEARRLSLDLVDVLEAVEDHWRRLGNPTEIGKMRVTEDEE